MKDILVKLLLKNSDYNQGLKESEQKTKSFANSGSADLKKMAAGFIGVAVVVSQVKKGLADLANETRGIAKVEAVIKATGGAAGIAASDIEKWTDQIQKTTEYSQDTSREVAALGLTFKNISKNVFPEVLSLSADMAAVVGTDMKGAMMQLAKAIDDPANQMTALRRSGVSFTNQQKEQIKVLQASGDQLGAQNILLKILREQIGGAAQAIGTTWIGTITRAKNAFDDLRKEFLKGFFMGGNLDFLEYFISQQDEVKAWVKQFAYDLTHNTILTEFKKLFDEVFKLIKTSMAGWKMLWDVAISPVLNKAAQGWKMIFAVATTSLQNLQIIFKNIGDIATDVFSIATMQIEIMIAKAFSKIKPLMTYIQTYLQTGSFDMASKASSAESKLGEATVYRKTMDLANYDLQSGDTSALLKQNMDNLGVRISEILTESITTAMPQTIEQPNLTSGLNVDTGLGSGASGTVDSKSTDISGEQIRTESQKYYEWLKEHNQKIREEAKKAELDRIKIMQSSLDTVINLTSTWKDASLNIFGKMAYSVQDILSGISSAGGALGLSGSTLGYLGLIGTASGFVGSLFGSSDSSSGSSSTSDSTDVASSSSPSANITKTGPDTVYYQTYVTVQAPYANEMDWIDRSLVPGITNALAGMA